VGAAEARIRQIAERKSEKSGGIVEIVQNQEDGRQIAPSPSPRDDLSVCENVGGMTAISDVYGNVAPLRIVLINDLHCKRSISFEARICPSLTGKLDGFGGMLQRDWNKKRGI
jgi:hypothetical protein